MKIMIVSDAWLPQVNGVVTTLRHTIDALEDMGHQVLLVSPALFGGLQVPMEPGLKLAICRPARLRALFEDFQPDAVHIATEGPLGWLARHVARSRRVRFTTAFHTQFPAYLASRFGLPAHWTEAVLRRFHAAAERTLVPTRSMADALRAKGYGELVVWGRGVDMSRFSPGPSWAFAGLPRPVHLCVARVAPEKNLEAFLSLERPGSKVVIGDGPALEKLRARFPAVHFLGAIPHEQLVAYYRAADVFVFPSLTDTFGLVMLEAMACGLPVAAFPVAGPRDVVGPTGGVLDASLDKACDLALQLPADAVRSSVRDRHWRHCTAVFLQHLAAPANQSGRQAGVTGQRASAGASAPSMATKSTGLTRALATARDQPPM